MWHNVTCQALFEGYTKVRRRLDDGRVDRLSTHQGQALRRDVSLPRGRLVPRFLQFRGRRQETVRHRLDRELCRSGRLARGRRRRHGEPGGQAARGGRGIAPRRGSGMEPRDQISRSPVSRSEREGRRRQGCPRGSLGHRSGACARLSWTGEAYRWSLDPSAAALDAAMQPLVESAVNLLTSAKLERLRRCGNSTCYWLFVDETRNHSRRWCEMASCGNVLKVRRHREKARSAAH